jgi:hypothetical protein
LQFVFYSNFAHARASEVNESDASCVMHNAGGTYTLRKPSWMRGGIRGRYTARYHRFDTRFGRQSS